MVEKLNELKESIKETKNQFILTKLENYKSITLN